MENEQLRIPGVEEQFFDPVIQFVVNGLRLSLQQNKLTREQAEEMIRSWYPDVEIILDEEPTEALGST